MKKILLYLIAFSAVSGCLSPAPKAPRKWYVTEIKGEASKYAGVRKPSVKLVRVDVRAPYDTVSIAVLRADGSIAFDPGNAFAAAPARLLAGAAADFLESSGFADVVLDSRSSVPSPLQLEIVVTRLALDCRKDGRRDASVQLVMRLVESRKTVSVSRGEASALTGEADYTESFSTAFSRAMSEALKRL